MNLGALLITEKIDLQNFTIAVSEKTINFR
jgi:hypothetical protein